MANLVGAAFDCNTVIEIRCRSLCLMLETCLCSATQELRGLGLANLMGAAFNCYTTTGSFSRSAIMNDVGAKTQLAGITSGTAATYPASRAQPADITLSEYP